MSRSGYMDADCCDTWDLIRWRGAVASAIKGSKGQKLLREMAAALDAMPVKELVMGSLESHEGVCALGCVGKARGIDLSQIDPEEPEQVAQAFGIATALAAEVAYMNDEAFYRITPEERWQKIRKWVSQHIKTP